MTPQEQTVIAHLANHGPLTGVEAEQVYRIRHLPSRIFYLRGVGFNIRSNQCKDATGQRYVRYELVG